MSKQEKDLEDLRENINELDDKIIDLLNQRGKIVKKVSNIKKVLRLDVHQPQREKEIIDRIKKRTLWMVLALVLVIVLKWFFSRMASG